MSIETTTNHPEIPDTSPEPSAGAGPSCAPVPGSLPASSVDRLTNKWKKHVADSNWNAHYRIAWQNCIDDLRAEMEAANVRQPEENTKDQPTPGGAAENRKE